MSTPDISRHLFQPEKRYIGTFMQQGRVVTDEDLNAHRRLHAEDERRTFQDVICARGSPNQGFRISALAPATYDFTIESGSFYIGGLRFEAIPGQSETFLTQRDWLQIDADPAALPQVPTDKDLTVPGGTLERFDLVYLRAWEQCVSAVEDRELLEQALGGPDTSVYERRHRRIEVLAGVAGECHAAFQGLIDAITKGGHAFDEESGELISAARLTVGFSGKTPSDDLCQPAVLQGYLGAENQAIRVQLTAPDRFIWGFDNASPLYRVQISEDANGDATQVQFLTLPRDEFAQPVSGQAVEILPWGALLPNREKAAEYQGHLTTVATGFDPATGRITIETGVPQAFLDWLNQDPNDFLNPRDELAARRYFYLRVWTGGSGLAAQPDHSFVPDTAVPLAGTGLQVTFSAAGIPGSFWVIAARPNTPDEVVPWILTAKAPAFGLRQYYASLALIRWRIDNGAVVGSIIDCRSRFRPLCQVKGCCTILVGNGSDSHGDFNSIQGAVDALPPSGGEICVLRGRYEEHILIDGRSNIKIRGCGRDTLIVAKEVGPVIEIVDSQRIEITALAIEAPAVQGILCHASDPKSGIEHIVLTCLSILSRDSNSVAVLRGRFITFAQNEVRVLPLAIPLPAEGTLGRESAVFLQGEDMQIERNRILAEDDRAAQRGYGGLHIGGRSLRVEIRRNLIRGGNNNGITLGHTILQSLRDPKANADLTVGVNSPGGPQIVIDRKGCVLIDPFRPRPQPPDGSDVPVIHAGPALRDVRIVDNRIEDMGRNGISVERFFDIETIPDFITVEDLVIEQNRITRCMGLEVGEIPFSLRDVIGFGGVALADVNSLVIRENLIANNGHSSLDPICGVFVLHGSGIAIDGNRILDNGVPAPNDNQLPRPGRRGGIVLAFARTRVVEEPLVLRFDRSFTGPRQDGVPAARVHGNVVVAFEGRALEILALGPVSVEANQLTANGSAFLGQVPVPRTTTIDINAVGSVSHAANVPHQNRAATSNPFLAFVDALGGVAVWIVNLGVAKDIHRQLFGLSGLFLLDNLPTLDAIGNVDGLRFYVGGNVLFNDNQVILDALGPVLFRNNSSVLLGSLDDVSMNANQCDCNLAVVNHAETFGWSLRMADNLFKEGLTDALLSGTSLALMNTTTDNQGTHCFEPSGRASVSYVVGNRSFMQLNSQSACPSNDNLIPV